MAMLRHARRCRAATSTTRLLFSSRGWEDVIYRDELERLDGDGAHGRAHADAVAAARLDGLRAPRRRRDARGGRPRPGRRGRASTSAARRRSSRPSPRRSCSSGTSRRRSRPSASDRQEAEMDELMLDGNAVAGLLQEVFAVEMTTAVGTCGGCGASEAVGAATSTRRRDRAPLPALRQRAGEDRHGRGTRLDRFPGMRTLEVAVPNRRLRSPVMVAELRTRVLSIGADEADSSKTASASGCSVGISILILPVGFLWGCIYWAHRGGGGRAHTVGVRGRIRSPGSRSSPGRGTSPSCGRRSSPLILVAPRARERSCSAASPDSSRPQWSCGRSSRLSGRSRSTAPSPCMALVRSVHRNPGAHARSSPRSCGPTARDLPAQASSSDLSSSSTSSRCRSWRCSCS